jgi:hypothetical protein
MEVIRRKECATPLHGPIAPEARPWSMTLHINIGSTNTITTTNL